MNRTLIPTLALSALFFLFAGSSLHAQDAGECPLKQYASLDLPAIRGGALLVPVTIQGSKAYMILNTAYPFSSITEGAASRLALQIKPMPQNARVTIGWNFVQKVATANGLTLGSAQFQAADLMVISDSMITQNDDGGTDSRIPPVIGMLGTDVIGRFDVELDVSNQRMNLFSPDHCPGKAVYWSSSYDAIPFRVGEMGQIYFPMDLQGNKIETTLATANSVTTLSTDVTRKLFNFDSHSPEVKTETDITGRTTTTYRAMKLTGNGIEIDNARITLIDRRPNDSCHLTTRSGAAAYEGCFGVYPMQLGRNVLAKLRIYIAAKEKMIYFTLSEAPVQKFAAPGTTQPVYRLYSLHADCTPAGSPTVEIVKAPANGSIRVADDEGYTEYPADDDRVGCNQRKSPLIIVTYKPDETFVGVDRFSLKGIYPEGNAVTRNFVMTVIPPKSASNEPSGAPPASKSSIKPPRLDPAHPLRIAEHYYPLESRRALEQGRCVVAVTIAVDGKIKNASIAQSSGYPRLDKACIEALSSAQLIPATENGRPIEMQTLIPIDWSLKGAGPVIPLQ